MIPEFDEEELNRQDRQRDTELTLGTGMLVALGCGLLLLCIVCFWMGYSFGHRPAVPAGVLPPTGAQSAIQTPSSTAKPTAHAQAPPPATVALKVPDSQDKGSAQPAGTKPNATVTRDTDRQQLTQAPASSSAQVKPALAGQSGAAQGAQSASTLHVQPALSQVQGWMVQIATVAHVEDAEVLVNALKRRGYAVTVRRDIADTLLHVQTGPFVNRNDANAMRQKLLNDGYNAIVQP
jgi:DedD protein